MGALTYFKVGATLSDDLDSLISIGAKHVQRRTQPGDVPKQNYDLQRESRFVRYAAWLDHLICDRCGKVEVRFDGIFEEREWIAPRASGTRHWLAASAPPLPATNTDPRTYVRKTHRSYCGHCTSAATWPLAEELEFTEPSKYKVALIPNS
jgi:hypothetical protein